MPLFIDKLKLQAAAHSMHQFLPVVRGMYPEPPSNETVEAATVFVYCGLAQEVFGKRFADHLRLRLRQHFKFAIPTEIELRVMRIESRLEANRRDAVQAPDASAHTESTAHVTSIIRTLLAEAGPEFDDQELVKLIFPRFEDAVRRIKRHLQGIKQQSRFVMKR